MAGLKNAGHTEEDPDTAVPLLVLAACPIDSRPQGAPRLSGMLKIGVRRGSLAYRAYGRLKAEEAFACNYELNSAYRPALVKAGLKVTGVGEDGGTRIVELPDHSFYVGTGFLPQLSSTAARPHPLIVAFLRAAVEQ